MVREKNIEKQMRLHIESIGGLFLKWACPGTSGVPDRIAILPGGRIIFFEVKRPGGILSDLQIDMIDILLDLGCSVKVVDNIDELKEEVK